MRHGGPNVLELVDLPEPIVDAGKMLIIVEAISVEASAIARSPNGPLLLADRTIGYVAACKVRQGVVN